MKKPLNIEQDINHRKFTVPTRFSSILYRFVGNNFLMPKYNYHLEKVDDMRDCKGPCFLIWNHLSRRDHLFLMKAAAPRRISILAGYNEFFRSHLHGVFKFQHIIPKKNFNNDMVSLRGMNSIIKQGGCVTFAPEGMSSIYGHNQPIVPGTGHFLKHYGIPVYFLKLEGAYLTNNKISEADRKGRVNGRLTLLFSPEKLAELSDEQIEDEINEAFRHDDYEWNEQANVKYRTKGEVCDHLHDICYKCPRCGAEVQMEAGDSHITCRACGNGATMDDYYRFHPYDDKCVIPKSPSRWFDWQRVQMIDAIRRDPQYSFTEHFKVGCLPNDHYVEDGRTTDPCGEGTMTIDHDGIHFKGTKFGKDWSFDLDYRLVYTLVVVTDVSFFSLYIDGKFHDFTPDTPCVGKVLALVEEMHRLHVNTWKNFKWCDWMYADNALEKAQELLK